MIISPSSGFIVGVTQRVDRLLDRDEVRDSVDQNLIRFVLRAGWLPVSIPNSLQSSSDVPEQNLENWLVAVKPSALILSGGNDIADYPERDETERYLLTWAHRNRIPVLGICRGMQMMAIWAGVDLVEVEGHVRSRHKLQTFDSSAEWPSEVNSFHNWTVALCPPGFDITAKAEDGSIEAIKHSTLAWEGWMWHPERETTFPAKDIERLKKLFNGK